MVTLLIYKWRMLPVSLLAVLLFACANHQEFTAVPYPIKTSLTHYGQPDYGQLSINAREKLQFNNNHFNIEAESEEDISSDSGFGYTGNAWCRIPNISGLNYYAAPGCHFGIVRYYILYCCPKTAPLYS